jgi:hypothetical protein
LLSAFCKHSPTLSLYFLWQSILFLFLFFIFFLNILFRCEESMVVKVELPPLSPDTEPPSAPDDDPDDDSWGKEEKIEEIAPEKPLKK